MFWFSTSSKSGSDASELDAELSRSRLILWLTATILAVFFSWAYFFEITQVSRAPGAIMPSSNVQIVQSQDGGVIRAIKVSAGDLVQRGETMIELDDTSVKADLREAEAKAAGVSASLVRLRAEIFETSADFSGIATAYPQFVVSQKALMEKRRSAQNAEVEALKGILALIREEIDMNLPLMEQGDVSKTEILRLRRQEAEFVAKITNVKNEYFKEAQAEYNQLEEELEGVKQAIVQRRRQLEEKTIAAPINGVVKDIRITSEGGVIRPGEEIMEVVPIEKDFLVEVKLSPADIGFVSVGQVASVKVDAFDYTIYGDLQGRVSYLSADTLDEQTPQGDVPYYKMQVITDGSQFSGKPDEALQILPGMTATAEVQTGKNTILNYLLKPITKTLEESLGER